MKPPLRTRHDRLWETLEAMAQIGATPDGGVCRLALSEEDRQARQLLETWARQSHYAIRVDAMGNQFIRRPGSIENLPPVLTGSHLDSQPTGGRYDGVYGVLAGLEVLRTLDDHGIRTEHPIEVVNWTNEEGARFAPAMLASGVFSGAFDLDFGLSRTDTDGISVAQALRSIGYAGPSPAEAFPIHAAFELHIEQGPILEAGHQDIGVVTGAQGQRWFEIELIGRSAHAGTTPMHLRRDAVTGFAQVAQAIHGIGLDAGEHGRATIGMVQVSPNSRNVVPGKVFFSVEFRHPDEQMLQRQEQALTELLPAITQPLGLDYTLRRVFDYPPVAFDTQCIANIRQATKHLGLHATDMISGAGHDACHLSRIAPTAMIFIPCVEGISHNPAEKIHPHWAAAGADVLLHAILSASTTHKGMIQ